LKPGVILSALTQLKDAGTGAPAILGHVCLRCPGMLTRNDQALVEKVAREFVEKHGSQAVAVLRENAEQAAAIDDELAAKAWRDIADAAERISGG
jgi:hypothetical protein